MVAPLIEELQQKVQRLEEQLARTKGAKGQTVQAD